MRSLQRVAITVGAGVAAFLAVAFVVLAILSAVGSAPGAGPEQDTSSGAFIAAAFAVGLGTFAGWLYERR